MQTMSPGRNEETTGERRVQVNVRDQAREFLRSKRCSLWMNWDITDDKEIEEAIDWLLQTYADFARWRASH